MHAILIRDPGEHSWLELAEAPDPVPAHNGILLEVRAVGVNNADLLVRRGFFGSTPPIPGIDVAGIIVKVGPGVTALQRGMRGLLNPAVTCGVCDYCRSGDHGVCRSRRAIGQALDGGYAQFVAAPAENFHPIADTVSFEEAASIPSNFFTAWQMLFSRARLKPGETVLVTAAAGGVGGAAVQIARLAGARVIAVVGRDNKRAAVQAWGADETINHTTEDLAERTLALTGGCGAEVVLDIVGASLWPQLIKAVRAGGRIVCCGTAGGSRAELDILDLLSKQITLVGAGGSGSKPIASQVVSLFNRGKLRAHLDRVLELADAEMAHHVIAQRDVIGKIVLRGFSD